MGRTILTKLYGKGKVVWSDNYVLIIVKKEAKGLKAAATNVERFVGIVNKYTDLRELTPEVLRIFIERIIIRERTAKHSKSAMQQIEIFFRYIGKLTLKRLPKPIKRNRTDT